MTRALNIVLRTLHIGAMGIVVGSYAVDVVPRRLHVALVLTVGTGLALAVIEAGPRLTWFHEVRGVMNLAKVALLCAIPVVRDHGLLILLAVVAIGSVASHMPRRFRHYSVLYRRVSEGDPSRRRDAG